MTGGDRRFISSTPAGQVAVCAAPNTRHGPRMPASATLHVAFAVHVTWDDARHFLTTSLNPCYAGWDAQACIEAGEASVTDVCAGTWDLEDLDIGSERGLTIAELARQHVRCTTVTVTDVCDQTKPVWVVLHPSSEQNKRGMIRDDQRTVVACATGTPAAAIVGFHTAFERFAVLRSATTNDDRAGLLGMFAVLHVDPLTGAYIGAAKGAQWT